MLSLEWVSETAAHAMGLTQDDLTGEGWLRLIHPDDIVLLRSLASGQDAQPCAPFDIRMRSRDGRPLIVSISCRLERDSAPGAPRRLLIAATDVTKARWNQAEQERLARWLQVNRSLDQLGMLAGGIAHDFNNLLAAVIGNAELAMHEMDPDAPGRSAVEQSLCAARRAAELTNHLLAYSSRSRKHLQPVNLSEFVQEMGRLLRVSIPAQISLRYELEQALPTIDGDTSQLQRVVMNLLMNAKDAIEDGPGTITLATSRVEADESYLDTTFFGAGLAPGSYVSLEVSDTGKGMDRDTVERIFEPFFTTKASGHGLGLAAVIDIVRGHGGALQVNSEPGSGTTFKILFPVSDQQTREMESSAGAPRKEGSGTVLVIDDETQVRIVTARMLEVLGWTALDAKSGEEAVSLLRAADKPINCVLLDMSMPGMNGDETYQQIRQIDSGVPVLLMSGYNESEATARFSGAGLAGFLQKPFTLSQLAEKLGEAVAQTK